MEEFKWDAHELNEEFKFQGSDLAGHRHKVAEFQGMTDDIEECVTWAINSVRNDMDFEDRVYGHGTGAELSNDLV